MLIMSAFKTPAGWIDVTYDEHFIHRAKFTKTPSQQHLDCPIASRINKELMRYFTDPHYRFQLPLKPQGSAYQLRVWHELLVIPAGRTMTYGALATLLQSSPRAVGQACKHNSLVLFIPCHRVVGKDNYGGFMGDETAIHYKLTLLRHENPSFC